MASVNKGSSGSLTAATATLNRDLAIVQQNFDQANASGIAGDCAASFLASRAAKENFLATKHDVEAVSRYVGSVRHARVQYEAARRGALRALQELYNAIAGHPLVGKPSEVVDSLHATMAADDAATAAAAATAGTVLASARQAAITAKKAAEDAALAPCFEVSA
jgi:hypothetical protein